MCGIFCSIGRKAFVEPSQGALDLLHQRGPDSLRKVQTCIQPSFQQVRGINLTLYASVLSLRGHDVVEQPLSEGSSLYVFSWNGEAWQLGESNISGNDTAVVFGLMVKAVKSAPSTHAALKQLAISLTQIRGPYAFVFLDAEGKRLFYARDCLGRRSLVQTYDRDGNFFLASVPDLSISKQWTEVEADGLYMIDLSQGITASVESTFQIASDHIQYKFEDEPSTDDRMVLPYTRLNKELPDEEPQLLDSRSASVQDVEFWLKKSLQPRISEIPKANESATGARLAILFSGGLDCTLLARLVHDILPQEDSIDLLNVAFQNPRIHTDLTSPYGLCPDRQTGKESFAELKRICPSRTFRLICIDVPYSETESHRQTIIDLIHPHNTEMDFSIACALYFASRGIGQDSETGEHCSTSARVLLSGLGADELFGGYQRHTTAFSRHSYRGLVDELELDISRLGKRNLGRDDRVISHWGREARYPYLDEGLVAWALAASVWLKTGFRNNVDTKTTDLPPESDLEPGKLVLRLLAWKLGMVGVAKEKKRAIQFGARTAKMQSGRTKGTQLLS